MTGTVIICQLFPNDIEEYIGLLEILLAIGEAGSPVISKNLIYNNITNSQFKYSMIIMGSFGLFALILCLLLIPNAYNSTVYDEEIES